VKLSSIVSCSAFVVTASVAWAQPAKPAARPAAPAACVGDGTLLYDPTTKLVGACDYEGKHCAGVDPTTGTVRPLSAAPKAAPSTTRITTARDAVCTAADDASCVKLGKKAAAALKKAYTEASQGINEGNPTPREPETIAIVSDDKAFAVLGYEYAGELWDLKKDKPVRVKVWTGDREFRKGFANPVGFVGDLVVFTATPCAGPCAESRMFTRAGKGVGKAFDGVGTLLALSPGVAVAMGQQSGAAAARTISLSPASPSCSKSSPRPVVGAVGESLRNCNKRLPRA
jgi:hypothetical protein